MPTSRSQYFLIKANAEGARNMVDTVNFNKQVDAEFKKLERALIDYSDKDRRTIMRKAAQKVAVAARRNPGFRDSEKPHYRYNNGQRITYNPGNLRRSLRVLSLGKTNDAFIGPQFATRRAAEYGKVGQPVDGYYAAMLFGSSLAFIRKVLAPALRNGRNAALAVLRKESAKAIAKRGVRRGLNIRA